MDYACKSSAGIEVRGAHVQIRPERFNVIIPEATGNSNIEVGQEIGDICNHAISILIISLLPPVHIDQRNITPL
jgi:hypothetical protein